MSVNVQAEQARQHEQEDARVKRQLEEPADSRFQKFSKIEFFGLGGVVSDRNILSADKLIERRFIVDLEFSALPPAPGYLSKPVLLQKPMYNSRFHRVHSELSSPQSTNRSAPSFPPTCRIRESSPSFRSAWWHPCAGFAPRYFIGFFARSSATISAAACRALSAWSGGKLIAPTRACPPPP